MIEMWEIELAREAHRAKLDEEIHQLSLKAKEAIRKPGMKHVVYMADREPFYREFDNDEDFDGFVKVCRRVGAYHAA